MNVVLKCHPLRAVALHPGDEQEWAKLHEVANNQGIWKKTDTKSGITVSRAAFADRSSCDLIKVRPINQLCVE